MTEELQQLIDKINSDGVAKAKAEAAEIVARAKADAAEIVKAAEASAAASTAKAKAEADAYAARAKETIRQAARDTLLSTEDAITKTLEAYLSKGVAAAAASAPAFADAVMDAIRALAGDDRSAEVTADAALAQALRERFASDAKLSGVKVAEAGTSGSGFTVRLEGGRVEHDFRAKTLAAALSSRLRPALAELINPSGEQT